VSGRSGARCFPFEGGNIRAVYGKGAICVVGGDGAVENEIVLENVTEGFLVGASKHAI